MADPFFKDLAFAALAQTARNPTRDFLQATPRNPILGYLSDLAASSYSPERTQQMQGVAKFMSAPAISETLDRLSYGEPLTTGAGGLGGTTRVRPEALEAAMAVAPTVVPALNMIRPAVKAGARALGPTAVSMGEGYLQRQGLMPQLDVYHGNPHKFDRFDASKIGTGEGAQAYGHGIYTAENPRVADEYAGKLSKPFVEFASGSPENIYEKTILEKLNSIASTTQLEARGDSVRSAFEGFMNPRMWKYDPKNPKANSYNGTVSLEGKELETAMAYKKAAERLGSPTVYDTGSLYKVDLPDEQIAKMLDWDKPLSEQSVEIRSSLAPIIEATAKSFPEIRKADPTGAQLYRSYVNHRGNNADYASEGFRQAGIPGIKYLDEGSRGAGTGTRNFVTFPGEEQSLTILERNNQPVQQAMNEFEQSLINFMATPAK